MSEGWAGHAAPGHARVFEGERFQTSEPTARNSISLRCRAADSDQRRRTQSVPCQVRRILKRNHERRHWHYDPKRQTSREDSPQEDARAREECTNAAGRSGVKRRQKTRYEKAVGGK